MVSVNCLMGPQPLAKYVCNAFNGLSRFHKHPTPH